MDSINEQLTPREQQILALAAAGLSDAAIAERLRLRKPTVVSYFCRIYRRLDIRTARKEAIRRYQQGGR